MARGWESKSVEDQITAREAESAQDQKPKLTTEELQNRAKQESLMLARTRTLVSLQTACDTRYRAHLEQVLKDLESQLASLQFSKK